MKVLLASCGNPDHGQNPDEELWGCNPNRWASVKSLKEASDKCVAWIERNDLGGGNWAGGMVNDGSKTIARISYNGRVWSVEKGIQTQTEIKL